MTVTVKLSYLDKQLSLEYHNKVYVLLDWDFDNPIGICEIFTDDHGKHFGKLTLNKKVDENVYFYYYGSKGINGYFNFKQLVFSTKPLKDKPTTQLFEMIV